MAAACPLLDTIRTDLLIDGRWSPAVSGQTFAVENPATLQTLAHVADGDERDAARAIIAAGRSQNEWGTSPPRLRADILRTAYD
jgi:succinate-semialdehyde dehydrogenase / glutarate-semialdehyde dehydrogenase